jgi:replicative DNA helicase
VNHDDLLRRTPPQAVEAEQSVLGAILLDNEAIHLALEVLSPDDFYRQSHRELFGLMRDLAEHREPIDAVTLTDALRTCGRLEAIGGPSYISELAFAVPTAKSIGFYAQIVRVKSIQRALISYGTGVATKAQDAPEQWSPDYTEELLACAEYDLSEIANKAVRTPENSAAEMFATALYNLEHRVGGGIRTGFAPVDQVFGGFIPGHVTVVGARTSLGKTALGCNITVNAAKAGYPVIYFTLEMGADEMLMRALGTEAMVDVFAIQQRGYRGAEQERVEEARRILEPLPLRFVHRPGMRPRDLRLECKRLAREIGGLKLAIIDYVNLMRGDQRHKERWTEMRELVVRLKEIAGELGIPLLVLSQVNREVGEYDRPSLGHLRDTGAAEEHSSNVLFLWEPKPAEAGRNGPLRIAFDGWTDCRLTIAKQRNGPAGMDIPMRFKKSWGKFEAA